MIEPPRRNDPEGRAFGLRGGPATVTSKGQITIPQAIRKKLALEPGTVLDFDDRADYLRAIKRVDPERMRSVVGIGRSELARKSVAEWLDELRGPVALHPTRRRRRR